MVNGGKLIGITERTAL